MVSFSISITRCQYTKNCNLRDHKVYENNVYQCAKTYVYSCAKDYLNYKSLDKYKKITEDVELFNMFQETMSKLDEIDIKFYCINSFYKTLTLKQKNNLSQKIKNGCEQNLLYKNREIL